MKQTLKIVLVLAGLNVAGCGGSDSSTWHPAVNPDPDGGGSDAGLADSSVPDVPQDAAKDEATMADVVPEAGAFLTIVSPKDGEEAANPVTFVFTAGGGVQTVWFEADGYPLQTAAIPATQGTFSYKFSGVNQVRHVIAQGRDATQATIAMDDVSFTPVSCRIPDQGGFNHYTVAAINDAIAYPKNGTQPYCWEAQGSSCGAHWGMVHDGVYAGETIFEGGGDCFCSGHTLEVFLRAYKLWQKDKGVAESIPFEVDGNKLLGGDVDPYGSNGGEFYQYWQGFGVTNEASSADAFEQFGIGKNIVEAQWDQAIAGDYVNLSRSTGSGHAVIFVNWIVEAGEKTGLRYYGCNSHGDSCPDPDDPANTEDNSGPSFNTERFEGHGGTVLPQYLFIGRAYEPTGK